MKIPRREYSVDCKYILSYLIQSNETKKLIIHTQMTVDDFLSATVHPMKKELLELRRIIRESSPSLTEHIKWNAPSFCDQGDDRITFNLSKKDALLIIFHRGAKSKTLKLKSPLLTTNADLLEWPSPDRGIMKFNTMDEVKERTTKLKSIVKEWISITAKYAA